MRRYCRAERLPKRDNGFRVDAFHIHEIFVSRIGIAINASLAWLSFTATIAAVFKGEDVRRRVPKKLIDIRATGNVARVSMERQKRKFRLVVRNPPGVKLRAIGRRERNILNGQSRWIPIARKPARIIWEK